MIYTFIISLFYRSFSADFDTLSGPLPKQLPAGSKPYLVIADIEVPFGETVTIEPGAGIALLGAVGLVWTFTF